jgi:hypothetical protein
MIRSSLSSALLMGLSLASCGGEDFCQRASDMHCDGPNDVEACEENVEEDCSPEEVDILETYLDCWEDAGPVCATDPPQEQVDAQQACLAELDQVSEDCLIIQITAGGA